MKSAVIWQIVDSAFPSGGFAHSGGLEAAARCGEVNGESLPALLSSCVRQQGSGLLPFLLGAHRSLDEFPAINYRCEAFLTNHVARTASSRQGRALISSAASIFDHKYLHLLRDQIREEQAAAGGGCHFAPAFGAVAVCLGLAAAEAARCYLFVTTRDLVSSAIRLGVVGPLAGQAALFSVSDDIESIATEVVEQTPVDAYQTSPLIDLVQATHHRLYSRLFQS